MRDCILVSLVAFLLSFALGVSYAEEFTLYTNPFASGEHIAAAPDGHVWFKSGGFLAAFDSLTEELQIFRLPSAYPGNQVAVDTSGAVWVHCNTVICRVVDGQLGTFFFPDASWSPGVIAAAPDGSVWATLTTKTASDGMSFGIVRFDGTTWSDIDSPVPSSCPSAICFSPDGTGWFAWTGPGEGSFQNEHQLARYRDGEWQTFDELAYGDRTPKAIAATDAGDVWLATDDRVYHIRNGQDVAEYSYQQGDLAGWHPADVAIDSLGRVWVPDNLSGVSMFDGENWTTFNTLNSGLPSDNVNGVAAAPDDRVWFTTGAGLASYHNGLWSTYTGGESTVVNNDVWSVAVDGLGRTFYGTYFGQVGYFDGSHWKALHDPGTAYVDKVYDIAFGPDGTVWLACDQFLRAWKGMIVNYSKTPDGMPLSRSTNLCLDQESSLWVCAARGLAKYDGSSWKSFQASVGSPPMAVTPEGIACDLGGRIWVGTQIGLAAIKDDQLDRFLPQYKYVHTIACDRDGMLWLGFGVSERGVLVFECEQNEEIAWYTTDDGLPSNRINSIACDDANNVWVGTNDGLAYFDGSQWKMWDIDSGVPVNEIRDIAIAPNGDVWFATPAGLLCHESGVKPPAPSITIKTDKPVYHAGETMTVTIGYENPGPDIDIDIQIACMLPDGSLYYYPGGDVPVPFSSGMLPSGTKVPMVLVLSYKFPDGFPTGRYTWLAVICEQGTFNFLSDISSASFTFE